MPHDHQFVGLVPDEVVQAAAAEHEPALAALGLGLGDAEGVDDVLAATEHSWGDLGSDERDVVADLFVAMFEHGRAMVLEQLDRQLDDLHDDAYISVEVSDFVEHAPARATQRVVDAFDRGEFDPDLDAIVVDVLRSSRVQLVIAIYVADVDELLREAGVDLDEPTSYITRAVLRSVGARTIGRDEDLAVGSADYERLLDGFEVGTACAEGQPPLDWMDAYELRLVPERAAYPEAFGSAWLLTRSGAAGLDDDGGLVLDRQRDVLSQTDAPPRCGVSVTGPADRYEGIDVTPFVVGNGFTVELRLTGLHTFQRVHLASRAQLTLELGG
ncbi:MAG: hypothetical protein B7733_07060 [Myxococcales bacterium FL481]|nr:MAG: hypothetical protein B7733_07060 [Myxococcales bacterium FL481]